MGRELIEKAIQRIPAQLRREEFRFVPILSGEKRPFELQWNVPGGNNYRFDDPKLAGYLLSSYNWGTCTGMGGLIIFDSDAEVRLEEIGVAADLPKTFAVRTGGGGLHRVSILVLVELAPGQRPIFVLFPVSGCQTGLFRPSLRHEWNLSNPL